MVKNITPNSTNNKKRFLLLIPFILILIFITLAYFRINSLDPSQSADNLPNVLQGKIAPHIKIPLLQTNAENQKTDSQFFDSDSFKGQVTLVNFWGSWCPPCRDEHPFLMSLANNNAFKLVGVNYKDNEDNARRFLNNFGDPFSEIGFDHKGRAAIDWGVYGPPETFILDKKGIILYRFIGPMNAESFQKTVWPIIEKANNS